MDTCERQLSDRLVCRRPEDSFVERKPQSVKSQEIRQTPVAFSNSLHEPDTAVLFIGVEDKTGTILGIDDPERIQMRVGEAGEECYPAIRPAMTVLRIEGKNVLAVEVPHSKQRPHFAGPAYIRSGSRSLKASEILYRDLLTSHCGKAGELLRWKDKCVTVRTINKKPGNHHPDWEQGFDSSYTAKVISCEPFSVTFDLLGTLTNVARNH